MTTPDPRRPGIETKHLAQLQQLVEFLQDTLGWDVDSIELQRFGLPTHEGDEDWKQDPTRFGWTICASPKTTKPDTLQKH